MPDDQVVLRSARNAYMVLVLLLLGISTYQLVTVGVLTDAILLLWVAAAGVFYGSKWYYNSQTPE